MTAATPEHRVDHPSEHLVQDRAAAVEEVLWRYDPIRQTESLIGVTVAGDVATLRGNVRSDTMKGVASRLALSVPGIGRVVNGLVSDTQLEVQVAMALAMATDVSLFTDQIQTKSLLGTVYLGGVAAAPQLAAAEAARARAEQVVRALPGVHEVHNQIRALEGTAAMTADAAAGPADGAPAAAPAGQQAIAERLQVWRERAAARGG